ncbi:MAG: short-chain fatty acyl-CoA regulator family protein [Yoonia sp.]
MAVDEITGTRIRDRRVDRGIKQADLAARVGISPPYLNLIEHNKRRIAGKLLTDIAAALDVPTEQLSQGVNASVLDKLHAAAASFSANVELARAEDMTIRFPGWSALIVKQAKQVSDLQDHVRVLTDRMTYDPELAGSLHQVITAVTSVRSAASILVGSEEIDADWQARFHRNIYDDSVRLAASSEALIRYLDTPDTIGAAQTAPVDDMETALAAVDYHIAALERTGRADLAKIAKELLPKTGVAHDLMLRFLTTYQADAALMPLDAFGPVAKELNYDPLALSARFGVPVDAVLRRLSGLPKADGHPSMGLAVADASGAMLFRKPVGGFALPRAGAGCPLWPLFTAFGRPDQPIRADVALPDAGEQRFLCYAVAKPVGAAGFDAPPVLHATMLIIPDLPEGVNTPIPAGVSCRICPRQSCAARREPSAMR